MKILHIIKNLNDNQAINILKVHAKSDEVSLLLIQDGVLSKFDVDVPVYVCKEDAEARGVNVDTKAVTYPEMVELITSHDKVISW
jgi:sulfur relay protein TusB/DsrH